MNLCRKHIEGNEKDKDNGPYEKDRKRHLFRINRKVWVESINSIHKGTEMMSLN